MGEQPPLGRMLRRYRTSAALTQEELAERAGVSVRTLSDVERGLRGSVHPGTAERLADALGLREAERRRFEAAARSRRGPPRSAGAPVPGVPALLPPMIGRDDEREALVSAFTTGGVRLLTVTGPGGVGKTRLGIDVAEAVTGSYGGGAVFVPLAAHRDPHLVGPVIAAALGLRLGPGPQADVLSEQIGDRHLMLVLDTFEHLLGAAPLVGALIAACPRLTVLITSRSALHLRGEHEFPLGPLASPTGSESAAELDRSPAVALFLERARAVAPQLRLDEATAPVIAGICRRLDGLPLALELAAARARHLPLDALYEHLERRLDLLTGGPLDAPPHQRTLRDTVAWSYDLLDRDAQRVLREVSVFAGGWTLDAAQAVCTPGPDLLDRVSTLVDQSLVHLANGSRYAMLDVIAEYAGSLREAEGETAALERRHADHFLALAERAETGLGRADQGTWYRLLADDHANLRAALRTSLAHGSAETAVRLAGALWQFWRRHGDVGEGRTWLAAALALLGPVSEAARSKALWGAGWLAYHQGDLAAAGALGADLCTTARNAGDPLGERNGLTILGKVSGARGEYDESAARLEAALALCPVIGSEWLLATSLFNLGVARVQTNDPGGATFVEDAVARYRRLGDAHFTARAVGFLVYPALERGDLAEARSLSAASLTTCAELGELSGLAECLDRRAAVLAACDRPRDAARLAGAAEGVRRRIAVRPTPDDRPMVDGYLASARSSLGDAGWEAAERAGRTAPLQEVVAEALAREPSRPAALRARGGVSAPTRRTP